LETLEVGMGLLGLDECSCLEKYAKKTNEYKYTATFKHCIVGLMIHPIASKQMGHINHTAEFTVTMII
jgi:hypothetical protein